MYVCFLFIYLFILFGVGRGGGGDLGFLEEKGNFCALMTRFTSFWGGHKKKRGGREMRDCVCFFRDTTCTFCEGIRS